MSQTPEKGYREDIYICSRSSVLRLSLFSLWEGWDNVLACLVGVLEVEEQVGEMHEAGKLVLVTDLDP